MNDTLRRSQRPTTIKASMEVEERLEQRSQNPTSHHVNAMGRAISNDKAVDTFKTNQTQLALLKGLSGKEYKSGTTRIAFKGKRDSNDMTPGTKLAGAKISRGGWSQGLKTISESLSEHLKQQPGFIPASHNGGSHGSEIAHIRAQHAGGMTDALGAQPASWHSNVEDMAREESQAKLAKKYGDDVRMKSTVYLHKEGLFSGTVKASRHKIFLRDQTTKEWHKKFDHLQQGHRGNINKDEVKQLSERVSGLTSASPTIPSRKGIAKLSDISDQHAFKPRSTGNDSARSPYFTDVEVGKKRYAGEEGSKILNKKIRKAREDIDQANGVVVKKTRFNKTQR